MLSFQMLRFLIEFAFPKYFKRTLKYQTVTIPGRQLLNHYTNWRKERDLGNRLFSFLPFFFLSFEAQIA
jgi:hypothetical protein